jgi:fatty acid desaturase
VPEFRRNYALERAAPDSPRVRFWRAFDRYAFPLVLAAVFVAVLIVAYICYDVAFATPTVSGIQHAALPLIAFRGPFSLLVAILKRLNAPAK